MTTRDNAKKLRAGTPRLFAPSVSQNIQNDASSGVLIFEKQDGTVTNDTSLGLTASFKYNPVGTGLVSTQQLNVDWSNFADHTFFNSAQVKTSVAFQKIMEEYPFDGTRQDVEVFLDKLTGFERYVYDNIPKHKDYLFFSGTQPGEASGGSAVIIKDIAGAAFPDASANRTGETILNPGIKSMTVEFHAYIPEISSSNQVVMDKHIENSATDLQGFYVSLNATGSLASGSMTFHVLSGSVSDSVTVEVVKGQWNHVAWTWDRTPNLISGFVNQTLFASSSNPIEFGYIDASVPDLTVGSGSLITGIFSPDTTFSGALDELRIWHNVRSPEDRANFEKKAVFGDNSLKGYYKFNEPPGISSTVVIDYSTNSIHGRLSTSALLLGVRDIASGSVAGPSPMTFEKPEYTPVLFPDYSETLEFQSELLVDASNYDEKNPNLITKLVPRHYLLEGQAFDALDTEQGTLLDGIQSGSDPRESSLGDTQSLIMLMYVWAKFFDEMKLYTQAFANLDFADYDNTDTVPDEFLQNMAARHGINLPPLFQGSSIDQFINAENIQSDTGTNTQSLQGIQNQIWRRVLINMRDFVTSKGTLHSVKAFIRSVGIDPDSNFRIREYGGPTKRALDFFRDSRSEVTSMLNFISGGLLKSPFLSEPRVEPGFPDPRGDALDDALLTSGSFTVEGLYRLNNKLSIGASQSLMRMHGTGSASTLSGDGFVNSLWANVVSVKGGSTTLFYRQVDTSPVRGPLTLAITGADLFDGDPWYVSFGLVRDDDASLTSDVSSSLFLRLAKQVNGEIFESYTTSSFHQLQSLNIAQNYFSTLGPSGSFLAVGSQSIDVANADNYFLNAPNVVSDFARHTEFDGKVGQIRFFSKHLTEKEWPEHVRNYRSVGVQDPKVNFNFNSSTTGSWERLRLDVSSDQPGMTTDALGNITLTDFTQNGFDMTGSGFPANSTVLSPQKMHFSYISPKYDVSATTNKVRVRSYQNYDKVAETPWAQVAPVNDIVRSELPTDNERFTIDFSVVDALDQDIVTIFSTLDELDNAIGAPELLFSSDYPDLENLRQIYFNKLTDKMNLKGFFEFFKWFDTNIGTFVAQLIPRKTKFLGTNYVIESHMLERNKTEYHFEDIYLGDSNRSGLKDTILLQLITGQFNRY